MGRSSFVTHSPRSLLDPHLVHRVVVCVWHRSRGDVSESDLEPAHGGSTGTGPGSNRHSCRERFGRDGRRLHRSLDVKQGEK